MGIDCLVDKKLAHAIEEACKSQNLQYGLAGWRLRRAEATVSV